MKVLCIKDGENTFGTNCEPVKKGQIYNVHSVHVPHPSLVLQGFWYELEEMPNYTHWSGLFVELSPDEILSKEDTLEQIFKNQ